MSGYERIGAMYRALDGRWPPGLDDEHRAMLISQITDCEANVAAGLSLFLQGEPMAAAASIAAPGNPDPYRGIPLAAAFGAAADALLAAIGDDTDRAALALAAVQSRAADYREAHELMLAQHGAK